MPTKPQTHAQLVTALQAKGVDHADARRIASEAIEYVVGRDATDIADETVDATLAHALSHDATRIAEVRVKREAPLRAKAGVTSVAPAHELSIDDALRIDAVNPASAEARANAANPHRI